jgi:hypothetical protein
MRFRSMKSSGLRSNPIPHLRSVTVDGSGFSARVTRFQPCAVL